MTGCYDCGLAYGDLGWIEAVIPDRVWNAIRPDGCGEHCGLLCITCIARAIKETKYDQRASVVVWDGASQGDDRRSGGESSYFKDVGWMT